jgi:hypothetical protein
MMIQLTDKKYALATIELSTNRMPCYAILSGRRIRRPRYYYLELLAYSICSSSGDSSVLAAASEASWPICAVFSRSPFSFSAFFSLFAIVFFVSTCVGFPFSLVLVVVRSLILCVMMMIFFFDIGIHGSNSV